MRREFTTKTRRQALARCKGRCEICDATLWQKARIFDHIIPCAFDGTNELTNCQVLCTTCDDGKTDKKDIPMIAKAKRISDRHNGINIKSRGFAKREPQHTATRPIRRTVF